MADFFQIRERAILNKRNIKDKKALQKAYDLLLKKEKQYKSNSNYVSLVNRLYHSIDDFDSSNMDSQAYNELKKDIKKVLGNDSKQIIESLNEMQMRDIVRKHKRELQKAKKTGNLELSDKAEEDLYQWAFDNEGIGDDPDDFIEWLDNNLDDILRGKIK